MMLREKMLRLNFKKALILFLLIFLFPFKTYALNGYVINDYDVDIIVNKDNTFDVTEKITAYFNESRHGIYRKIPLKNKVSRLDGSSSVNRAKVSNVSVDNEYDVSKENGYYVIKIGDADKTVLGTQSYTIKYTYNIGKDLLKDVDELYYNIIGDEWDTDIYNVTFSVKMPEEFDESKLGFSHGSRGLVNSVGVTYSVSGNTIKGSFSNGLKAGEALTIRCELPEGYFSLAENNVSIFDYLMFALPLCGLVISFLLWFAFGRDKKVVETTEFYPPEGFNSLEVAFLYKGKADNEDVISLLIYLADKGYIKITEIEEKSLFTKSQGFKITKLKNYDGSNTCERLFLEGLFRDGDEVTLSSLYNRFYMTVYNILQVVNSKENKDKIFEHKASNKKGIIILCMLISYILITSMVVINYGDVSSLIFALIFPAIGFSVLFSFLLGTGNMFTKIFGLIWGLGFGGIPWFITVFPALIQDSFYMLGYFFSVICIILMGLCLKFLSKRTPYGLELLGKIKGFRNYLLIAEKDRLEQMVLENPNYFYDILPYAYVLGVSDKWIKKFEVIAVKAPEWYDSPSPFTVHNFGVFMGAAMQSASAVSSSSSSGSSGSTGGGSSGGGSGGGGGGSW